MNICLITPPSIFLLDERVFMTLGILKVAAVLEEAGHKVEMIDLSGVKNYTEAASFLVSRVEANIFGITATTPQLPAAIEIVGAIREARPGSKIILGGPHVTLVNAAHKREKKEGRKGRATKAFDELQSDFNVLVAGDGEEAIFLALKEPTPNIIDADEISSDLFLKNKRLAELPLPARHLIDVDSYHYYVDGERALSLIAQLGCPFECGFCGGRFSPFLRKVRIRPAENIIQEMEEMHIIYGIRGFMIYDDELNVNREMIKLMNSIAELQQKLGVQFKLRGFIKSQLFTDEQAKAMHRAGFRQILVGFESGSQRILKNINKRATREENTRCLEIAKRHDLKVKALMSIGHPGESFETIEETHRWLLEVRPDDFDVTIITTYPGTPYYDLAVPFNEGERIWVYTYEKTGDKLFAYEVDYRQVADYYKGDPEGGYHSYVYTDFLKAEELVELRNSIERDVREKLGIPFNLSAPAIRFEHSMGQFGPLPTNIFKTSQKALVNNPVP